MINKYWTVKEGVVGTAHRNRYGFEVDFRPSSRKAVTNKEITMYPPLGQTEVTSLTLPYQVTKAVLGSGENPNTRISEISFTLHGVSVIVAVEDDFFGPDSGPITSESLAFHEEWKTKVKLNREEAQKASKKEKEDASLFLETVVEKWKSLSSQQRKWVRRYLVNAQKAEQEANKVLRGIDPVKYQAFVNQVKSNCNRNYFYPSLHQALCGLKEKLNIS